MTDESPAAEEAYEMPPREERKLGSDGWRCASYFDDGHREKVEEFFGSVQWDRLANIACRLRGVKEARYPTEKFAVGRVNMVRRLTFEDGVDWVVRVRLNTRACSLAESSVKKIQESFNREVAAAAFFKAKTSIRVPEIFAWDSHPQNEAGVPYMFMEYIHGSTPNKAGWIVLGEDGMYPTYGTRLQHYRMLDQLARIHAELASWKFNRIGDLCWDEDKVELFLGSMRDTRDEGPWDSAKDFYEEYDTGVFWQPESYVDAAPILLLDVLERQGQDKQGPFRLWNKNLSPTKCLLDDDYNIMAICDLDGISAVPLDVVARFPIRCPDQVTPPGRQPPDCDRAVHVYGARRSIDWYTACLASHEAGFGEEDGPVSSHLESMASSAFEGLVQFRLGELEERAEWFEAALDMLMACGARPVPERGQRRPAPWSVPEAIEPLSPSPSATSSDLPWTCTCAFRRGTSSTLATCSSDTASLLSSDRARRTTEASIASSFSLGSPPPSPVIARRPTASSIGSPVRERALPSLSDKVPLSPASRPPRQGAAARTGAATSSSSSSAGYMRRLAEALTASWTEGLPSTYLPHSPTDRSGDEMSPSTFARRPANAAVKVSGDAVSPSDCARKLEDVSITPKSG